MALAVQAIVGVSSKGHRWGNQCKRKNRVAPVEVDYSLERKRAAARAISHKAKQKKDQVEIVVNHERKARIAQIDVAEMRLQAERRISETRQRLQAKAEAISEKRNQRRLEYRERRDSEIQAKQRRRAEIYATNAIMREYYQNLGLVD